MWKDPDILRLFHSIPEISLDIVSMESSFKDGRIITAVKKSEE